MFCSVIYFKVMLVPLKFLQNNKQPDIKITENTDDTLCLTEDPLMKKKIIKIIGCLGNFNSIVRGTSAYNVIQQLIL